MLRIHQSARELPPAHISVRVPWHDAGWNGTVCRQPKANGSCLALTRVGETRDDVLEADTAGERWDQLDEKRRPACLGERGSFMAPFEFERTVTHPYQRSSAETHGHFLPTPYRHPPYSAACIPFRWMLRSEALGTDDEYGIVDQYELGFDGAREPDLSFENSWIQERENQLVLLDTFFSAVKPQTSLCFFYAKRTPLSEDSRRVLVGVGRVTGIGEPVEYRRDGDGLRALLWERNVSHSIRSGGDDGFLLPYAEILRLAEKDEAIRPDEFVAFAPDDHWTSFSFASEHVNHDGAIGSLLALSQALQRIKGILDGPWDDHLAWVDRELSRLWAMRGPFPGLGSALCAFGIENGNLIAFEIERQLHAAEQVNEDPWPCFEAALENPSLVGATLGKSLGPSFRKKWKALPDERRALLTLLSRFDLSVEQLGRFYLRTEREDAGINVRDQDILEDPYRIYELDRYAENPISLRTIDRGLFPDAVVREKHPVPAPSAPDDASDGRRSRAFVVEALEVAANSGHTIQPRDWVIRAIRDLAVKPACPVDDDSLDLAEERFGATVHRVELSDGSPAYQLDRYRETRQVLRAQIVKRHEKGKPIPGDHDWRALVDDALGNSVGDSPDPDREEEARHEKAAALETLFHSRVSVLIGPAGTGKTTMLRTLCGIREVEKGGVLLLAPTGKARVRMQKETQVSKAMTLAQFLLRDRYDPITGRYFVNPDAGKVRGHKTVIVDESSMLTEEQLAALLDAVSGVDRLILVGDFRQLPPIGAGRPFVDTVRFLRPDDIESRFPRCDRGYAELTITRRQQGDERDDLLLARWFSGAEMTSADDAIWDRLADADGPNLRTVSWKTGDDLADALVGELVRELGLQGPDDEDGFEESLGGSRFGKAVYFNARGKNNEGAAARAEAWQILSPVRGHQHGVDSVNRMIQERFRTRAREWAEPAPHEWWMRRTARPFGAQGILYGDKVINVVNKRRNDVFPKQDDPYVANGDIGMVVGQFKSKAWQSRMGSKLPFKLEVEFTTQPGAKYGYKSWEFGDDGSPPLELAYSLTVHKCQGSEFGVTFVVLPNPCWLLSRELLYTALTRHQNKVVLLYQGDVHDLLSFSDDFHSDIAARLTNLFFAPTPVKIEKTETRFFEDGLIHRTQRGDLVRSKSEVVIANMLFGAGLTEYAYEAELKVKDGSRRYPDFTIEDPATGETFYWEHLGLLHVPKYRHGWEEKLQWYRENGIVPHDEGGGENGTLIITRDSAKGAIDSREIEKLITEVIE